MENIFQNRLQREQMKHVSVAVSVRKNVLSKRYRWKKDILSGSLKNVKCVLDVFTDVRNLQSSMAMIRQSDMDGIKIRTPEFRRKHSKYSSNYRSVIRSWSEIFRGSCKSVSADG